MALRKPPDRLQGIRPSGLFRVQGADSRIGTIKQQIMLVNENRLNLADPKARKYLMEQTERHFFGGGADTASGYVPPAK